MPKSCEYDAVVIGCGLAGSVIARKLVDKFNFKILIIEKRDHIGGNMYDFKNKDGILYQKYGPHTFHTNNKNLYEFISQYEEWENYNLECMTKLQNKFTPTPFNFQTIDDFYDKKEAERLKQKLLNFSNQANKSTIVEILASKDSDIKTYADFLFKCDYEPYTAKQWGIAPSEIDVSILKRVPVYFSYNNNYFEDIYQCIPKHSFHNFFLNLLNHENITIKLNTDGKEYISFDFENNCINFRNDKITIPVIYTGAIDYLLDFDEGLLPYRSLEFKYKILDIPSFQPAAVVAYPCEKGYTRITEYTKLPNQINDKTLVAFEYPSQYTIDSLNEPYYPIQSKESSKMYQVYKDKLSGFQNFFLCGRLADFKYYNMDQVLENALLKADEIIKYVEGRNLND